MFKVMVDGMMAKWDSVKPVPILVLTIPTYINLGK